MRCLNCRALAVLVVDQSPRETGWGSEAGESPLWGRNPECHCWGGTVRGDDLRNVRSMRAIDLYAGVGGWGLGLQLAGVEIVASYEWWDRAADTHHRNLGTPVHRLDIRELALEDLPGDIDVVVGSPPCTQFSFANRGGNGDLADGLKDIAKFLQVVEHLKPRYWAMENVPRVAGILRQELQPAGSLAAYAGLVDVIEVIDSSEFGVPQARERMIAGSFPIDAFLSYRESIPQRTLGDVLEALRRDPVLDPIYDVKVFQTEMTDHVPESPLSSEEERMNREAKTYHPVYNRMRFPDDTDRPARTITALCTRVSRESIVIEAPECEGVRRLTLRERSTLQGFPVSYQFFGRSYSDKLKMVGNALPPPIAYYLGRAISGIGADDVVEPADCPTSFDGPVERPHETPPPALRKRYPSNRTFRGALPNLRFGSGMRFELTNTARSNRSRWQVKFFYGTSGAIRDLPLGNKVLGQLLDQLPDGDRRVVWEMLQDLGARYDAINGKMIQERWTAVRDDTPHPFEVVDELGALALAVHERLGDALEGPSVAQLVLRLLPASERQRAKLTDHAGWVLSGLIVGSYFNTTEAAA
jgi:DNA (cytosine-5)-methyltransferase 1